MTTVISSVVDGMMACVQAMRFGDPRAIPEASGDFRGLIPARSLRTSGINPRTAGDLLGISTAKSFRFGDRRNFRILSTIWKLMTVSRHGRAAAAGKKVEVGSTICLHHVIEVELVVPALEDRLRRFPFLSAAG